MEAKDLRIGNIVGCKMSLDGYTTVPNLGVEAFFTHLRNGAYHPIPLTEEWLIKLGFDSKAFTYYLGLDTSCHTLQVLTNYDNDVVIYNQDNEITVCLKKTKYVHQIQNLVYALTNTELTINL